MGRTPHTSVVLKVLDPDELATAIRHANFNSLQISPRPAPSEMGRMMCPHVCLDFVRFGPSMLFSGTMPQDCYTLIFVLDCPQKGHSFNFAAEHGDGYMGFFPPGGALDAMTPAGYANATLTIPSGFFHAVVVPRYPGIPDSVLKRGGCHAGWKS